MSFELFNWMRDVSRYVKLGQNKLILPVLGKGVDYADQQHKQEEARQLGLIHPKQMRLRLLDILPETASTRTFRFERLDGALPPFRAGQYINLHLVVDSVHTSRPFSVSSAPGAPYLDITVRDKPGGFVAPHLHQRVEIGDEFETSGPVGCFYHEPLIDGHDLVFLAGGSGITPFMSIIREQQNSGQMARFPLDIHLVYGSRTPDDIIFGEELEQLARAFENFSYSPVISEPPEGYAGATGLLDRQVLSGLCGPLEGKMFYLCGPNVMLELCRAELIALEVPRHRIRRELYGPPADVTQEPGWPTSISADTTFQVEVEDLETITARACEPLLNALERNHITAPALCRSGECGVCRTRLLSGDVFMPADAGVRETDRQNGYIHPCVAYPITDLKVRF